MSTDEDCNTHNTLCDRRQVNGASSSGVKAKNISPKQLKSTCRKKNQKQCSRNHLALPKSPLKDQWIIPETPSPYFLGSKKRQNGDKVEQTSVQTAKRTCLSERFLIPSRSKSRKEKCIPDLSSAESTENSKLLLKRNGRLDSLKKMSFVDPDDRFEFITIEDACKCSSAATAANDVPYVATSSSSQSSSSSSNQNFSFNKDETSSAFDDPLSRPSTSKCGQNEYKPKNSDSLCKSNSLGVNFIDTDSDDSGLQLNGSSLNGGKGTFDPFTPHRKVIGKGLRKVLESDDEENDDDDDDSEDASWQNHYRRGVPLISSDSDDSSDMPVISKKSFKKRSLSQLSSTDSNDGSASSYVAHSPPHTRTSTSSKKSSSERSSDCSHHSTNMRDHSYATRQTTLRQAACESNTSSSLSSSTSLSSQSNTSSSSLDRSRRYPTRDTSLRQTRSPHIRVTRSGRQNGLSRSAISHLGNIQHPRNRQLDFAARYPDIFDAEESSDMEFFTANSYSDTEASISTIESFGGVDVSSTTPRNYQNSQAYSVSNSSPSEDEISVIFTTGSAFPEANNRSIRTRGLGGRRRRTRGSTRIGVLNTQEVVSVSPDPVEQVRQMEEDEQFARMLQAQYDAEVVDRPEMADSHNSTESDNESTLESAIRRVFPPHPPHPRHHAHVIAHSGRARTRFTGSSNMMFLSGGRRRTGRRTLSVQGDPWMFQFARILGLSPAYTSPEDSEYEVSTDAAETLLQFAESVGGDVPRGLHKTEIGRLPTRKFYFPGAGPSTSQGYEDVVHKRTELNKECQVCLSDYENGDLLRILPCFHEFHTPCIDPWLKINHTCPVCRVEVVIE